LGTQYEAAGVVPEFDPETQPEEFGVILDLLRKELVVANGRYTAMGKRSRECPKRPPRESSVCTK